MKIDRVLSLSNTAKVTCMTQIFYSCGSCCWNSASVLQRQSRIVFIRFTKRTTVWKACAPGDRYILLTQNEENTSSTAIYFATNGDIFPPQNEG